MRKCIPDGICASSYLLVSVVSGDSLCIARMLWSLLHVSSCRPDAAAASQLLVAPGGDLAAIERVKPFLEAHGRLLPLLDTPAKVTASCIARRLLGHDMQLITLRRLIPRPVCSLSQG